MVTRVPTAEERAGNFSNTRTNTGALVTIYDPLTTRPDPAKPGAYIRDPFVNNTIPQSRFNPVSLNVLKFIPLPNQPGDPNTRTGNYLSSGGGKENYDQWGARVDQNFGEKIRLFGMVGVPNFDSESVNLFKNIATGGGGTASRRHRCCKRDRGQ